jgi:hypothetical protein
MPKVNVYVPQEMLDWIKQNDIKYSAEFQTRINEIRGGAPPVPARGAAVEAPKRPHRVRRVRVRNNSVNLHPYQRPVSYYENENGERFVVVVE